MELRKRHYEINPLPDNRGWRLELLEDDVSMGGGVFECASEEESILAWNEAYETGEEWAIR